MFQHSKPYFMSSCCRGNHLVSIFAVWLDPLNKSRLLLTHSTFDSFVSCPETAYVHHVVIKVPQALQSAVCGLIKTSMIYFLIKSVCSLFHSLMDILFPLVSHSGCCLNQVNNGNIAVHVNVMSVYSCQEKGLIFGQIIVMSKTGYGESYRKHNM